jgi:hypothetical protein
LHKLAILAIAIIALYFSFQSLVQRDYIVLTSPVPGTAIAGRLEVNGSRMRTAVGYSVRIESQGKLVASRDTLPAAWDTTNTQFPDGSYHAVVTVTGKVLCFPVLSQIASVEFTIDNTRPSVIIAGLEEGEVLQGTRTFSISVHDGKLRDVVLDNLHRLPFPEGSFAEVFVDTVLLADGLHEMQIVAVDEAGNKADESIRFVVDNSAPSILSLGPAEDILLRGQVTLHPAIDEPHLASVTWYIDNQLVSHELSLKWDTETAAEGTHSIRLEAADACGLESQYTAEVRIDSRFQFIEFPSSSKSPQALSRSVYVNGNQLEDDVLKVFAWPAGSQLSLVVSEAYAGELKSSLEMEFTAMGSLARFVKWALGDTAALLVDCVITDFMDTFQHMGLSFRPSLVKLPFITDLLNEQHFDEPRLSGGLVIATPLFDTCYFADGPLEGMELRMTFDQLALFTAIPTPIMKPCIAIGELAGSYHSELVEETFSEDSWETTVLNKSLSAAWAKIGLLIEMWPALDVRQWELTGNEKVQRRKTGIPYKQTIGLGLQITSWEHVKYLERTVRYYASSETNAKRPPMPDRTYTEIAREVFFTFALYVDVEIGFGP